MNIDISEKAGEKKRGAAMKRHRRMKGEAERATRLLEKVAGTGRG